MPRRTLVDPRFATRLRELLDERSMSFRALAARTYYSKSALHAVASGKRAPTLDMARRLDEAIGSGNELAELVSSANLTEAGHLVSAAERIRPWETAELLERIRASDTSAATVEALHVTAFELCCAYGWQDALQLRVEGLRWLREVERLLFRPMGLRQHQELLTVAGWLALLVGCVEYDLELRPAAEATRVAALQLAQEGGNTEIAAWAWEMSAWFALTQGRHREVVTAAEAGQSVVGEHTAAVQLVAQEAKARARMGDVAGVRSVLERGRRLLDRFPPPTRPDHHFVVDPDKWDFYAMDAYRLVGEDALARHHAGEVLRLGTAPDGTEKAPMRMAEARLTLGAVTAREGELEQAVDVALTAFRARRRSLPQLLMVAVEVGDELRRRDPRGRPVAEFREAVRSLSIE